MIGIIVELIISWLLLWLIDKKDLSVLGFKPTTSRIANLSIGLLMAAFSCITYNLMVSTFANNNWILNKQMNQQTILTGAWWTLKSVLFEELIFRGALLYLAIEKFGVRIACTLSAVCFGMYHWFSFNLFGNAAQMVIIFLMTGIFGLTLAYAFAKTKSIYLPVGLHLGWNFFTIVVFSNGPLGQQILIRANENQLEGVPSVFVFLFQIFALPLFTLWYLNILLKRKNLLVKAKKDA